MGRSAKEYFFSHRSVFTNVLSVRGKLPDFALEGATILPRGSPRHAPSVTFPASQHPSGTLGTYISAPSAGMDCQASSSTASIRILRHFALVYLYNL